MKLIRCKGRILDISNPVVMGILNVTPDSFYSNSRKKGIDSILHQVEKMLTEGAKILELKLLPGIHEELGFYFGYVKHSGTTSWLTEAAPFISDALIIFITFCLLG